MTLYERIRHRLRSLLAGIQSAARSLHQGLTIMPMAGGAPEDGGGEGGEPAGAAKGGGEGEPAGAKGGEGGSGGKGGGSDDDEELDLDRAKAKISKANSEAANLRKRVKELEPLAAKAKDLEDSNKSDLDKANDRASNAETDAKTAKLDAARLRVALKKGLTETQAKRLVGETEEELEADADELLDSFKPEGDGDAPRRPRERLRPGAAPSSEPEENDPEKLAAKVPRMY